MMGNSVFIRLSTLIERCDLVNGGDAETFGFMNPGYGVSIMQWPIGVDGDHGLSVLLSLQEIIDEAGEQYPGYPLNKMRVHLELSGDEEDEELSFNVFTNEVVEQMKKESLN